MENYKGKEKCRYLRELRIKIAEANNIDYTPVECTHEGDCMGFCPACDAELNFITQKLEEKAGRGEQINIVGLQDDEVVISNYPEKLMNESGISQNAPKPAKKSHFTAEILNALNQDGDDDETEGFILLPDWDD